MGLSSMRFRMVLAMALVVLIATASLVLFVRVDFNRSVVSYFQRGGMMGLDGLADDLEEYYRRQGSWDSIGEVMAAYEQNQGGMGRRMGMMRSEIYLADSEGQIVYASEAGRLGEELSAVEVDQAIRLYRNRQVIGYLIAPGTRVFQQGDERPILNLLSQAGIRAALVAGALSLLIALLLSSTVLKPVLRLTKAAENMAAGDLSQRVPVSGSDELGHLAASFNTMAASLQASEARRKALTADVAHELRTPLSIQRAQLEALQDGVYPLTAENLQIVMEQNEALSRLVDDLRTLALADAGELSIEHQPVNLVHLMERVSERFRPVAENLGVALHYSTLDNHCAEILGDVGRIEQILNNLLGNALRYVPAGKKIEMVLSYATNHALIRVRDEGPGIPEESLPYIFERFYRAERSRSRTEGGAGLGLAISRQLARAHGGDLTAQNSPEGGAEFTLSLPIRTNIP